MRPCSDVISVMKRSQPMLIPWGSSVRTAVAACFTRKDPTLRKNSGPGKHEKGYSGLSSAAVFGSS